MPVTRKLAAIMVADIVGYSRLMRGDETGTYEAVRHLRTDLLPEVLASHGGRLLKDMGDGFLVSFDSAVQAVDCGMALQQVLAGHDLIEMRIGVNVGDVIVEADDVFGDGVNVAARLESVCTPGGVAMSDGTYEQVRDKLKIAVETLEPQWLKNIDRPVGVRLWKGVAMPEPAEDLIDLSLPDKPSIAVLAFANMSSDPEQEFFADGIAEDIITAVSRIERFFVVSRTSSFSFKGQNVHVKQIGEALGVRYVLEGSVRAAGGRLRVSAQLIDAESGSHVWAEKYDRRQDDIFDIQDEIVANVVASMQTHIELFEAGRIEPSERMSLPAWKLVSLARAGLYDFTPVSLNQCIDYSEQALSLDPRNASAHQTLAMGLYHLAYMTFPANAEAMFDRALEMAETAVRLAPKDETAHWARGLVLIHKPQLERAIADFERAIEINPNYSVAWGCLSSAQGLAGLPNEAITSAQVAMRSNPRDPSIFFRFGDLAVAYYLLGDLDQCEFWARKGINLKPSFFDGHLMLVVALQARGQQDAAREALRDCARNCGTVSLERARAIFQFSNMADTDAFIGLLQAAGLRSVPRGGQ